MPPSSDDALRSPPSRETIERWLREVAAEVLNKDVEDVDTQATFSSFGFDSATNLIVTDMLEQWLGRELDPTLLYEYETIAALAAHLATPD